MLLEGSVVILKTRAFPSGKKAKIPKGIAVRLSRIGCDMDYDLRMDVLLWRMGQVHFFPRYRNFTSGNK